MLRRPPRPPPFPYTTLFRSTPTPTPEQEVRRLYEEAEARVAKAAERVVSRDSFGELLAQVTENAVALTRIANEGMDLLDRKSTRLNSSHSQISYAVFCLKKK